MFSNRAQVTQVLLRWSACAALLLLALLAVSAQRGASAQTPPPTPPATVVIPGATSTGSALTVTTSGTTTKPNASATSVAGRTTPQVVRGDNTSKPAGSVAAAGAVVVTADQTQKPSAAATGAALPVGAVSVVSADEVAKPVAESVAKPAAGDHGPSVVRGDEIAKPGGSQVASIPLVPFSVSIAVSYANLPTGTPVPLTATSNIDVGPTPFSILIQQLNSDGSWTTIASCGGGTICTATVSAASGSVTFNAVIAQFDGSDIRATAPSVTVTWS